jgi:hypothetical protein
MTTRTSGLLVSMISLREVSGFSAGTMPAAASSGRVSSKMRPLESAMVIHRRHHPQHPRDGRFHRDAGHAAGDHQVDAERRVELAERHVHRDDDAEPHQIPVEVHRDRHQQRQEDEVDRDGVEEHAGDQQQQLDRQQHRNFRQAGAEQGCRQVVEGAQRIAAPGEDTGQRHHRQDHR